MIVAEAEGIVARVLHPEPYHRFFEQIVGRAPLELVGGDAGERAAMLGADPRRTVLDAYHSHAPRLTCHAHQPSAPPPAAGPVADGVAFEALIRRYHAGGYTVRVPDVTDLSAPLRLFVRALELLIGKAAEAALFWSAPAAAAPVHYDEYDIIVVQLSGRKRWFVSTDPPGLNNQWKGVAEPPPPLRAHRSFEVGPGDLIYLPRGTPHTVQSLSESLHVSIGFVPVTVRDAIIAALDHLSDADRPLREGLTARADDLSRRGEGVAPLEPVIRGLETLLANARRPGFLHQALARRASRMIGDLPKLPPSPALGAIGPDLVVRHSPLAVAKLLATPELVDFAQPGAHVLIHRGVEEALRFMASTPAFRVREVPGAFGDDIRAALVGRLLASGFLEVVPG